MYITNLLALVDPYTANDCFLQLAYIMAETAEALVKQQYPGVPVAMEVVQEPQHLAVGNGFGIMFVSWI